MEIHCPVCSTAIEITEAHLGAKGRCFQCQSKFIIPNPGEQFQILEQGVASSPPPAAAAPVQPAQPAAYAPPPAAPVTTPARGPALNVPATARRPVQLRSSRKKSGGAGFMIALLVIGSAAGVGFMLMKQKEDEKKALASENNQAEPEKKKTDLKHSKVRRSSEQAANDTAKSPTNSSPGAANGGSAGAGETTDPASPEESASPFTADATDANAAGDPANTNAQLSEEKKGQALAFLISDKENKRKGAYAAMRKLGDSYKPSYQELLTTAKAHHSKKLGDAAFELTVNKNSLTAFNEAYSNWRETADATVKNIQTNWKTASPNDYKSKHKDMDKAFEDTSKLMERLARAHKDAGSKEIGKLDSYASILGEIDTEMAWCEGEDSTPTRQLTEYISEAGGADDLVELLSLLASHAKATKDREAVVAHNKDSHWAGSTYKAFARILNERRFAIGQQTLRLDEMLSKACEGHSGDMLFQDYFSHTGKDGSSFGQRAKRANFSGAPTGECIYMGSAAAEPAHTAWWYSDGHRLIMYADRPNTLGLGTAEKYWTLNTGKK